MLRRTAVGIAVASTATFAAAGAYLNTSTNNPWRIGGAFHMTASPAELSNMIAAIHQRFPDVTHIEADAVEQRLAADPSIQLIDVREPDEFADGHIKGAVNIPVGTPDSVFLEKMDADKPAIIYCASGNRSSMLTRRLQTAGRTNMTNFAGSMYAWRAANKPVE